MPWGALLLVVRRRLRGLAPDHLPARPPGVEGLPGGGAALRVTRRERTTPKQTNAERRRVRDDDIEEPNNLVEGWPTAGMHADATSFGRPSTRNRLPCTHPSRRLGRTGLTN